MIKASFMWVLVIVANMATAKDEKSGASLATKIKGVWHVETVTCNGVNVDFPGLDYTLSFQDEAGAYVSKKGACTQTEPETYQYLNDHQIVLKQGIRQCSPNPCEADLPATECGKETNSKSVKFDANLSKRDKILTLTTNDPAAIDCTGPGQKKPAVFVMKKLK